MQVLIFQEDDLYNNSCIGRIDNIDLIPCLVQSGNEIDFKKKLERLENKSSSSRKYIILNYIT